MYDMNMFYRITMMTENKKLENFENLDILFGFTANDKSGLASNQCWAP